ncbi:hypothetical protein GCM10010317_092120 [Streptomyces mirabilis]|nr:hypothetical protein GCM10010317_092120 [Streptomyces mirabilis]
MGFVREQALQGFAFVGLGSGQGEGDWQALEGADQVQAQAPEKAAVAGAVAVFGLSGQVGAFGGLAAAATFERGGIHDPYVVAPHRGAGGQYPGDPAQEFGGLA